MSNKVDNAWTSQQQSLSAGRSNGRYASSQSVNAGLSSAGSGYKSALSRSYMPDEPRSSPYSQSQRHTSSLTSRSMTTPNMNLSSGATLTSPASAKTAPNLVHSKLHKRGSGSGAPSTRPAMSTNTSEPFPDIITPTQTSSGAKLRPYLRKLSSAKEDQGRIDLSKSLAENERLGLGIQDYTSRPETAFAPPGRSHTRTTSVGSQMSNGSGTRSQPFVHPMRQAPRPYTPTAVRSQTSSPQDGDDDDDFVDEDYRPGHPFRTRRSMSNSSTQIAPTPLSQTITTADLGMLPRLTSTSQSNLSIISTSSKPTGSRRNTNRSQETAISPSSRTSFDRPFGPRRSDTEAQTRDERIQAARRKFQEKEAGKDRKAEKEAAKRREAEEAKEHRRQQRERGKSDASERVRMQRPAIGARAGSALGLNSPIFAYEEPESEKRSDPVQRPPTESEKGGFFARLFGCTGRRK